MNDQQLATVLAALRHWQEQTTTEDRAEYPHFLDTEPLNNLEIDLLCEDLNSAAGEHKDKIKRRGSQVEDNTGKLYLITHEHKHGIDTHLFTGDGEFEISDVIRQLGIDYDHEAGGESIDWNSITPTEIKMDIPDMVDEILKEAIPGVAGYEINKEIVFSTGHITKEENDLLIIASSTTHAPGHEEIICDQYEYGFRVWTGQEFLRSDKIFNILNLTEIARKQGCKWLVLDRYGPQLEGLPVFDW